jgi:hypothetical protein
MPKAIKEVVGEKRSYSWYIENSSSAEQLLLLWRVVTSPTVVGSIWRSEKQTDPRLVDLC